MVLVSLQGPPLTPSQMVEKWKGKQPHADEAKHVRWSCFIKTILVTTNPVLQDPIHSAISELIHL
jgi:hypothetical protein